MDPLPSEKEPSLWQRLSRGFIGKPRDINEPSIFAKISLIPVLAWIGLGADGLSSSSYGPEEAFKALGPHTYLGVFLAIATAFTVIIISYAYSKIIEHFPHGGGGYTVSTYTIGKGAGLIAGSSLLVDYVLTITVSLSACGDAVFSYLPPQFLKYRLFFVIFLLFIMVMLNLRGVKESVTILAPIFIVFVITHVAMIGWGIVSHAEGYTSVVEEFNGNFSTDLVSIGFIGILAIFLRAFSLGGGTYTGIEAVSNAMHVMREPKVRSGKRTMFYLAASLSFTAAGLFICYSLYAVEPVTGRTMNAILADMTFTGWPMGSWIAFITILSEGALLVVGAQSGFAGGPSIMANMAIDSWLPRRFASLSERLTMQNGVLLIGGASLALLIYTRGSVAVLVIMYAINVFITFSLSQLGMIRFFTKNRHVDKAWARHTTIHLVGLVLCLTILSVTVFEKFGEGGWLTILITLLLIALCLLIRGHYKRVRRGARSLEDITATLKNGATMNTDLPNPNDMTAILLVSGYNGFGLHTWLSIVRGFPGLFKNFVFISVAEIDSGSFKGIGEFEALKQSTQENLEKYVTLCRSHGYPALCRMEAGTDVVETATDLCQSLAREFPRSVVFAGKLIFKQETPFQKILHNETAHAIQRRLQWSGITTVVLPIRVAV